MVDLSFACPSWVSLSAAPCPLHSWIQVDRAASMWDTADIWVEEANTVDFVQARIAHTLWAKASQMGKQ